MLGTQMNKSEFDSEKYAKLAEWCNAQDYAKIVDKGDYYEVVDCSPTDEELNEQQREKLMNELNSVNDKIKDIDVAMLCDNADDTVDVVLNGELLTMTSHEIDDMYTSLVNSRAELITKIKELK